MLFQNIICKGENGILFTGAMKAMLEDISFDHIRFKLTDSKLNEVAGGNIDLRGSSLQKSLFESDIPGFYAQYIKGLRISDFKLQWTNTRMPFFTNGIELNILKK